MSDREVERIPQHRHCLNCGKAFTGSGDYCSEECGNTKRDEIKKKKNILLLIWIAAALMMLFAIFYMW